MAWVTKHFRVLVICLSFSCVRPLARLPHVVLITSPSWGPYVSLLSHQHTVDIYIYIVLQQEKDCKALLVLLAVQQTLCSHIICYADDILLYVDFKPDETDKLTVLHNCLMPIKDWMANNVLQLNADKT